MAEKKEVGLAHSSFEGKKQQCKKRKKLEQFLDLCFIFALLHFFFLFCFSLGFVFSLYS